MAQHGILITFQDFHDTLVQGRSRFPTTLENNADTYFQTRKHVEGPDDFKIFYFETIYNQMDEVVRRVKRAEDHKFRVLIHGHCTEDRSFISSHAGLRNPTAANIQTIEQLGNLLVKILFPRQPLCSIARESKNTVVDVLSCMFGRSRENDWKKSNAWRLHQYLYNESIFVNLNARSDIMSPDGFGVEMAVKDYRNDGGIRTMSRFTGTREIPYSRITCTFDETGKPVVRGVDYSRGIKDMHNESELPMKKISWMYFALDNSYAYAAGKHDQVLINALDVYSINEAATGRHNPDYLYQILEYLAGELKHRPPGIDLPLVGFMAKRFIRNSILSEFPKG